MIHAEEPSVEEDVASHDGQAPGEARLARQLILLVHVHYQGHRKHVLKRLALRRSKGRAGEVQLLDAHDLAPSGLVPRGDGRVFIDRERVQPPDVPARLVQVRATEGRGRICGVPRHLVGDELRTRRRPLDL